MKSIIIILLIVSHLAYGQSWICTNGLGNIYYVIDQDEKLQDFLDLGVPRGSILKVADESELQNIINVTQWSCNEWNPL